MELPYFKAFPTDWEIAMRKAGIPPAKKGNVYRLIFFAWQEQGLNLTEDETYETRMRALAQAFGLSYCRFKPYLAYYKALSECRDGVWLPSFLLQQLQNALRSCEKNAPATPTVPPLPEGKPAPSPCDSGAELEQGQDKARAESEQSQDKARAESEQDFGPKSFKFDPSLNKQEQEQEQERESARPMEDPIAAPLPSPSKANLPEPTTGALEMYIEFFDVPPIYTQQVIEAAGITDLDLWRKMLSDWRTNGYRPRNVSGMIDKYRTEQKRAQDAAAKADWWANYGKGNNGQSTTGTPRPTAAPVAASIEPTGATVAANDARGGDGRVVDRTEKHPGRKTPNGFSVSTRYSYPLPVRKVPHPGRPAVRVGEDSGGSDVERAH